MKTSDGESRMGKKYKFLFECPRCCYTERWPSRDVNPSCPMCHMPMRLIEHFYEAIKRDAKKEG